MINTDVTEKNKLTVRRLYYEMLNQQNCALINDFFAPHSLIVANGLRWNNRKWIATLLERFYTLVPAPHFELMVILAEGDMVCASWKMIAKPENCSHIQTFNGICLMKMKENKIVQLNHRSDLHRIFNPGEPSLEGAKIKATTIVA